MKLTRKRKVVAALVLGVLLSVIGFLMFQERDSEPLVDEALNGDTSMALPVSEESCRDGLIKAETGSRSAAIDSWTSLTASPELTDRFTCVWICLGVTKLASSEQDVIEWIQQPAEAGASNAMLMLAALYSNRTFKLASNELSLYWTRRAIDSGSLDAMRLMARHHLIGRTGAVDIDAARRVLEEAALRGSDGAKDDLKSFPETPAPK